MKFGAQGVHANLGIEFIKTLDKWKEKITREGLTSALKRIISEDLDNMEGKRRTLDLKTTRGLA